MSVASPVIDYIDATVSPRLIYLLAGVREYHPVEDIYLEVRNLRRTDETLRGFDQFVSGGGNVKKLLDGSKRTPRYAIFNDCKVVPDILVSHDLVVTGEQLYAPVLGAEPIGTGAACIDKTPLPVGVDVNVDYAPAEAEVIVVTTGGIGTPAEVGQAVWDHEFSGYKARSWLHMILSFVGLKASGAGTGAMTFENIAGGDLAVVDHDGIGNRTGVTLTDPEV